MDRTLDGTGSRRAVLRASLALGGVAAMQGAASALLFAPAARAQTAELSTLRATSKSWLWAAEDYAGGRGMFEKAGLRVRMAATERGVNQDALLAGATDILLGAPTQNMRVQIRRQPVKMICGMVNKYASNIVIKKEHADRAGVTEASDPAAKGRALRGLRLGTTGVGAGPDQLIRYVMRLGGLDPDREAQLVPVRGGGPAMLAAMQNNQLDGFCLSSPTSDLAVQRFGAVYMFNMATNPPPALADYLYITASVTERTLREKGELLTAYCKGVAMALDAIRKTPADFKAWSKEWFTGMEDQLFETSFTNNIDIYMATPVPTRRHFELNMEFLKEELRLTNQPAPPDGYGFGDAWDLTFVEAAMRA
ncbi:ABC transporter substrate-binding protein [Elioraea sp.]|uniref:ABC transporter substrate-binding protein n=1 Tax=Elioraea sp. TaxID=2185103 RepID=UPI003F70D0F0